MRTVAIIGGGPAGLMAAQTIARDAPGGFRVTIYEAMPSAGRKFLMAGRGGLNLTHGEDYETFVTRYGDALPHLRATLDAFPPQAVRAWAEDLGQTTFVGSSGRVFPQAFKASPLLRAWLRRLAEAGVTLKTRHRWRGFDTDGALLFDTPEGALTVRADATVLALGGASWPKLGSDGAWTDILAKDGVAIAPLRPANAGFTVAWSDLLRERFAGQPLKRVALTFQGTTVRGEAMLTREGIEGGAVYALSAPLREALARDGEAVLSIALRPDLATDKIVQKLSAPRGKHSLSNFLRKALNLSPAAIGLLNEAAIAGGTRLAAMPPDALADRLNNLPVRVTGIAGLARAISTAGGVQFDALDAGLMLKNRPGVFVAGEMLDWEAPTGGYLLTAAFATGTAAGRAIVASHS